MREAAPIHVGHPNIRMCFLPSEDSHVNSITHTHITVQHGKNKNHRVNYQIFKSFGGGRLSLTQAFILDRVHVFRLLRRRSERFFLP